MNCCVYFKQANRKTLATCALTQLKVFLILPSGLEYKVGFYWPCVEKSCLVEVAVGRILIIYKSIYSFIQPGYSSDKVTAVIALFIIRFTLLLNLINLCPWQPSTFNVLLNTNSPERNIRVTVFPVKRRILI